MSLCVPHSSKSLQRPEQSIEFPETTVKGSFEAPWVLRTKPGLLQDQEVPLTDKLFSSATENF